MNAFYSAETKLSGWNLLTRVSIISPQPKPKHHAKERKHPEKMFRKVLMLELFGVEYRDFTVDLLDFLLILFDELFVHLDFLFFSGLFHFLIWAILFEPDIPGLLFFSHLNDHR